MKCYVADAFTDTIFHGNPAAVCVLEQPLSDTLMQNIAMENNLSETAFAVPVENGYSLRWFTPGGEVDLCGHATLASAYIILRFFTPDQDTVSFHTKSGLLTVRRKNNLYEMDLPAYRLTPTPVTDAMEDAIGFRPAEAFLGRDLICVLETEEQVFQAEPDQEKLKKLDGLLLQLTARGTQYDCVTRSFAPKLKVPEDPVCGSGHCHVIPLWSSKLCRTELCAYQASKRGGVLCCRMSDSRVFIAGEAALYSINELFLPATAPASQKQHS